MAKCSAQALLCKTCRCFSEDHFLCGLTSGCTRGRRGSHFNYNKSQFILTEHPWRLQLVRLPGNLLCIPLCTWWSEPMFQVWPLCKGQKKVSFVNLMASLIQPAYFQSSEIDLCVSRNRELCFLPVHAFFLFRTFLSPTILYQGLFIIKTIKWILTGDREISWHQQFSNGLDSLSMWSLPIWIQPPHQQGLQISITCWLAVSR